MKLGFLPEESPLYEDMTPLSYLEFFADLYDVPTEIADERIRRTLDRLELDHRDRRLGTCRRGCGERSPSRGRWSTTPTCSCTTNQRAVSTRSRRTTSSS